MPTYLFRNKDTGEEYEEFMMISELDAYLEKNNVEQLLNGAPALGDSIRLGLKKPPDSFRDVLREVKKKNSTYFTKSTVNTFD